LGIRVGCFDVYSREGERWQKTLSELLGKSSIRPTPAIVRKIFLARQRVFRKNFKRFIFKDAEDLLLCLHEGGYILGLVTGTPSGELDGILPKRIRGLFSCIVTGDSVRNGKPHPEPYLKAARLLGLDSSECVVIENAPLGVESAKGAGMFCIALTTSLPRQYLGKADVIADRLEEVSGLIESACRVRRRRRG
jgi:beta-phosphoglucomutase